MGIIEFACDETHCRDGDGCGASGEIHYKDHQFDGAEVYCPNCGEVLEV